MRSLSGDKKRKMCSQPLKSTIALIRMLSLSALPSGCDKNLPVLPWKGASNVSVSKGIITCTQAGDAHFFSSSPKQFQLNLDQGSDWARHIQKMYPHPFVCVETICLSSLSCRKVKMFFSCRVWETIAMNSTFLGVTQPSQMHSLDLKKKKQAPSVMVPLPRVFVGIKKKRTETKVHFILLD